MYIVVGLGNPGEEYERTRHNTGRIVACAVESAGLKGVKVLAPDTFMNKSGAFVAKHIKSKKAAKELVVIYDDLDLPLGSMRLSYNRSSGGHKGLESIIKALKTEEFIRIRIGISPSTPGGKLKKPSSDKVVDFVLKDFTPKEALVLKKVAKRAVEAVEAIALHGLPYAMSNFNQ